MTMFDALTRGMNCDEAMAAILKGMCDAVANEILKGITKALISDTLNSLLQ